MSGPAARIAEQDVGHQLVVMLAGVDQHLPPAAVLAYDFNTIDPGSL
jgi:hypothetical protein